MSSHCVVALYRPNEPGSGKVEAILKRHQELLRKEKLVTDRLGIVLKSPIDGTFMEIFEWSTDESAGLAHGNAEVMKIWDELGEVSSYVTFSQLKEAKASFPEFEVYSYGAE